MTKVLSVIGSCAGEQSNTGVLADLLFRRLNVDVFNGTAVHEKISLGDVDMKFCRSCDACFRTGVCSLEQTDGVESVKGKILDCDVLIFGSPVYLAHVSGVCKAFLDRISYWTHRMELLGKPCILISTTSNNHGNAATDYLEESFSLMGCVVAAKLNAYLHRGHPLLSDEVELDKAFSYVSCQLANVLRNPEFFVTKTQEEYFQILNRKFKKYITLIEQYPMFDNAETTHWRSKGYATFENLAQAISVVSRDGKGERCT